MYLLSICLFLPIIKALVIVQIHRNSIYHSLSSCAFLGNKSWSNDVSIQSCIWECVHEYDCQTAIYFNNEKCCSMFSESCGIGHIQPSGNVSANVICYQKNHRPIVTCPFTMTPNKEDEERSSHSNVMMNTEQDTTTTTTSLSVLSSFWSFDNNTLDGLSTLNGIGVNSPSYKTPGINGYGSALSLNETNSQFVNISTYRNLSYTSFTGEMWFYPTSLSSSDHGLFGQYQASIIDQSLHFLIRNYHLYFGFFSDDLTGSTTIQINSWYHVAFVYNYSSSTQQIYLNGKLDSSRISLGPYQGSSGSIVIGKTDQVVGSSFYFSGYIDQVSLVMRAKNSSEILDDATLVCWHSFDGGSYYDSGPFGLNGTAVNVTLVNGKVNQAISFTSDLSYYQIGGFVLLGISNNPYSIVLWVRPSFINGSILVHLSTTTNGQGFCVDLIGFSSIGQIIITGWGSSPQQVIGPVLSVNVWTHIVNTYSTTNGYRLYVNGTLIGTTGPMTYSASGLVNILTLANFIQGIQANAGGTCVSQSIVPNVYYGSIDEFRIYSRELNIIDIYTLANP